MSLTRISFASYCDQNSPWAFACMAFTVMAYDSAAHVLPFSIVCVPYLSHFAVSAAN